MVEVQAPVVLVGAFERDNFGDLLFPIVSRRYLGDAASILATPVAASTQQMLGEQVHRYVDVVRNGAGPHPVWVVGGEVGGPHGELRHQSEFDEQEQGLSRYGQAYLPRMSALSGTSSSVAVVNSVGLRNMSLLIGTARLEAVTALRELDYLSVRDAGSAKLLSRLGVEHRLAPDLMHSIAAHVPSRAISTDAYAVVQVNEAYLSLIGPEALAAALAGSRHLVPLHVRLLAAGLAPGHDSIELYEQVAREFERQAGGRTIEVLRDNDPLAKVATIAGADLMVSTSLHCAVISTAYGVPRVALSNEKLTHYLRTWEEPGPVDVDPDDLDDAIGQALALRGSVGEAERSRSLAQRADESARAAAAAVTAAAPDGLAGQRRAVAATLAARSQSGRMRAADRMVPAYLHARFRGQQISRISRNLRDRSRAWVNESRS
ncbi:polysaccharide pyruvyl transferase family protein [Nocardioides cavernaquae]|uniref:Polysaccharide pyruvyl transferase family protein n=1 Tax=Nocardioides cavernaquae TaxID=2321396 RepID=A0A3A5H3W7_9ACTN|nr:polysaccharide pyruvyl transferase family protein [Nocardioides cavernaquae]RJS45433.1 polysaccharide pyruvyl transferase family protein [Nocardioides cavernaquae]